MAHVLVVARAGVRTPVLEAVTIARDLGQVAVLALSAPSDAELAWLGDAGVGTVLVPDAVAPSGGHGAYPAHAGAVVAAAAAQVDAGLVLLPTSFPAKEIAAHAAWSLRAGLLIDVATLGVDDEGRYHGGKRVFAGTWETGCVVTASVAVVTLQANAVVATPASESVTAVVTPFPVPAIGLGAEVFEREEHERQEGRPPLAEAATVVAGGRGTEGDFEPVAALADALGAAVGTTRDCVDEGWQPHDAQIGQTGITIAPRLYIGAGISGAPHHHGGMQASRTIVAINLDPDAPLVQIADFAVIGDLASVLTEAADTIREHLGSHDA